MLEELKLRLDAPNANEPFDYFDEAGNFVGTTTRQQVHQQGLWHRSSHVFVFRPDGALLVQKRAADKDLYPGLWDYSVGEHLQPGETHQQAAQRGLAEELQITDVAVQVLGDESRAQWQGNNFCDREIQQAYRCTYNGKVNVDPVEIQFCWFVAMSILTQWVQQAAHEFTPWFVSDLQRFGWL